MRITACPKCGSKNISMGTMGSGVTFGITSWNETCRDCGYQGQPLVFDSEKEYIKFLKEVKHKKGKKSTEKKEKPSVEEEVDDLINCAQKDKEIINILKECEKEEVKKPIWPKNKKWWPEIVVSLIIAIFTYFSGVRYESSLMGIEVAIIYNIFYFIVSFIIFLFMIIALEYIIRAIIRFFIKAK